MFAKGKLKIEKSIKIINSIEDGKFLKLLNRIAQFMTNGTSSSPFTSCEEEKLENSLEISKSDVNNLIDGIIEIFELCVYHVIKPTILGEQMEENLSLNSKKAESFVQTWSAFARGLIDNYKQRAYFPQLSHIYYSLSVEGATNLSSKEKTPKTQLQLILTSSNNARNDLNLEFTSEGLYKFYKKLEQLQEQLDAFR